MTQMIYGNMAIHGAMEKRSSIKADKIQLSVKISFHLIKLRQRYFFPVA